MDRVDELRIFTAVADLRGFAQAARRLGISPAQVSKLIARLEDRLNTPLLNRTTRDVSLTDAGRAFHARARVLVEEFEQLQRSAQETAMPRGLLKVSAPVSFGVQLGPVLLDFARTYSDVGLEVSFTDRLVNLVDEGFDAAVRIGILADSSLVARRLATVRAVTIASPEYLTTRGMPRKPSDLEDHQVILDLNRRPDPQVWTYGKGASRSEVRVSGQLRFGNPYMSVAAARAGFGIACEPAFAAADDLRSRRVVALLKKHEPEPIAVYAVYPHTRHLASKVRVFVDFLAQRFSGEAEWHQGWD
jgi:DNA-binding transcriptional LysR family regulator